MEMNRKWVKGAVDRETRCRHYHQANDRIAIKFYCCQDYFSCYQCHREYGCGTIQVWPRECFDQKAILCGACGSDLTINEYLASDNSCPSCQASFNPGCAMHYHLYFQKR
ncbi:hypothetical protein KFZ56_14145 [Virgibacillus sp. NKC19-3]|uniref:CHY zinc finger protein n=1 Tax=Virgibacillus saliphilus TaxID=2831674 RepID=UPI001C9B3BB0|nr:CHY zinc finger protein [Virgibacillus sp. NKC19-3]MBY7144170.1 hypothetical protein [Virgibacillus sp. NKC19-3]